MNPFFTVNPFNSNEWWEISGNTRRLVPTGQRNWLSFIGATALPISLDWFLSYPIASG